MKFVVFISFLLLGCSSTKYNFSSGYKFLETASTQIERGQFTKARFNIFLAKRCDYGNCGNGIALSQAKIKITESCLLIQKKRLKRAIHKLNSIKCFRGYDFCETRDSMIANLKLQNQTIN